MIHTGNCKTSKKSGLNSQNWHSITLQTLKTMLGRPTWDGKYSKHLKTPLLKWYVQTEEKLMKTVIKSIRKHTKKQNHAFKTRKRYEIRQKLSLKAWPYYTSPFSLSRHSPVGFAALWNSRDNKAWTASCRHLPKCFTKTAISIGSKMVNPCLALLFRSFQAKF